MTLLKKILTIALMGSASYTFAKGNADTIFYGGPIVTVNQKNDEVQALAVQGGKIVAVGNKDTVMKDWQSKTTQMVDLKGQTLMPGFVEPHVHIMITSVFEGLGLNLSNFTLPYDTKETLIAKMRAHLKNIPKGGWLFGFGVDPSRTSPFMAELNADDLDKVSKIHWPKVSIWSCPFIPNGYPTFFEPLIIGIAAQKPEELIDNRL